MTTILLYLQLFYRFFLTGLFAVGGGLATLPFLQEMSRETSWFTTGDIADMVAVSESTPGPLGVNMASYVGYQTAGIPGSIIATLGLVTPSVIIILLIIRILHAFKQSPAVDKVFYGLRAASTAMILSAGLGVAVITFLRSEVFLETHGLLDLFNWKLLVLSAVIWILYSKWKIHPVLYIAASALIGIVFSL